MLAAVKYWVYKDSRILGPFDKNDVAGLPGLDASTLVCAGESAATGDGDWRPAGDVAEFAAMPLDRGAAWSPDQPSATYGPLDKLQLDVAGLIGDDEFPAAAEDLFQDADMKRNFGDLLMPRPSIDAAELRRAKNRTAELTVQLELLYRRVTELEAGQTNLVQRLAEKEEQLRNRPSPAPVMPPIAPLITAAPPVVPPPVVPPPVAPPPPAPALAAPQAASPSPAEAAPRPSSDERPSAAELVIQLELLRSRMAELEAGHWDLAKRVATAPPPTFESAVRVSEPTFVPTPVPMPSPVPVPAPTAAAAPAPSPLPAPEIAADWPAHSELESPAPLPSIPSLAPMLSPILAAPAAEAVISPAPAAAAAPIDAAEPPSPEPPSASPFAAEPAKPETTTKRTLFERKTFKIVPTVKAFRIVGTEDAPAPAAPLTPEPAAAAPVANSFDWAAAAPTPPAPIPAPAPVPVPVLAPPPPPPAPTPLPAILPPVTLSFGVAETPAPVNTPMPTFSVPQSPFGAAAPETPSMPAFTGSFGGTDDMAGAPSSEAVLARLAKPEPAPATKAPRAPRSNKKFLFGAAALVLVLSGVIVLFLRHPKDLKQMTELDDGRAQVGAEPTDDASRPPMIKPKMAEPPADAGGAAAPQTAALQAPAAPQAPPAVEAPQAASQAKLDAAVAAVKDFPLDGERGTVAQWLQFSYSAGPDAGKESWSASETADKTYLVEYRFTPSARGAEVHYMFEVDMDRGFVIGKDRDATSVLSGGPRAVAEKARPKAQHRKTPSRGKKTAKRAAKRADAAVAPKDVPLLALPTEGELRPPAEDDGAFNADTVDSGR